MWDRTPWLVLAFLAALFAFGKARAADPSPVPPSKVELWWCAPIALTTAVCGPTIDDLPYKLRGCAFPVPRERVEQYRRFRPGTPRPPEFEL